MPLMHSIEPLAEASERNGNVDEVREVPLDGFGACGLCSGTSEISLSLK